MGPEFETDAAAPDELASSGSPILLQAYFEHYGALVRFLARRLQCLATGRDLAQEVYFRLLRVPAGEPIENPRAFVFQVAANLTSDHRRVEGRRAELLDGVQELLWGPDEVLSPERGVLATDELSHLDRVLDLLPELSRRIFVMNRFECLTQREISVSLGVSISTVEKHIRFVLQRLSEVRRQFDAVPGSRACASTVEEVSVDDVSALLASTTRAVQPG